MDTSTDLLIDLHLRTICSDGFFPRDLLFDRIRDAQLGFFSVTDQRTLARPYHMTQAGRPGTVYA